MKEKSSNDIANFFIDKKRYLHDLLYLRTLSPLLSKNLILLLGCQRSGTTLSLIMLGAHPKIQEIDEIESGLYFPTPKILLQNITRGYVTCSKLPVQSSNVKYIKSYFPNAKILWIVRNPHSVVSSMRSLKLKQQNWLQNSGRKELFGLSKLFPEILSMDLDKLDEVSLGAYVWKYKNLAVEEFRKRELDILVYRYENLLENPKAVMSDILNFIGLEWSENVLHHENFYDKSRKFAGKTKGTNPLDVSRKEPKLFLTDSERELIASICEAEIIKYGYQNNLSLSP